MFRGRSGPPEVEPQFRLAFAFRGDFAVDLFGVVAAFGDGLRAGFQACFDLEDLRRSVLGRVDPVPFRGKPVAGEPGAAVVITGHVDLFVRHAAPAEHAMQQGREVFAVPGRVDSRASHGCHRLLREGAKLVESVDDVLEELGPLFASTTSNDGREVRHPAELQLNDQEQAVLDAIQKEATSIDQVVSVSGLPIHRVLSTISVLEMRRLVRRISGNQVSRY